jgi:hypothetical protein
MEQKFFLNEEIAELFTKKLTTGPLTEKNTQLKNGFINSGLLWFSLYGTGAGINRINEYLAGGTMPVWDSWNHPDAELFSGSFKWAFKTFSHFFGDWIILGKTYAWSPGDLMLMGSFIVFLIYFLKTLHQYFKK